MRKRDKNGERMTKGGASSFHSGVRSGCLVLLGVSLFALGLSGQEGQGGIPLGLFPPEMLPPPNYTPEERATIQRGLEDMKSPNPEIRAGAVMLLAKYEGSLPKDAVISGLADESPRVRRAAITAILEWNQSVPNGAAEKVLLCIGDPDAEVRRAASSAMPMMLQMYRLALLMSGVRGGPGSMLTPEMEQVILKAFQDEDVQVRRNMVKHEPYLNMPLPMELWAQLLRDEDVMVRLETLGTVLRRMQPREWVPLVRHMVNDENRAVRLRLIREMAGASPSDVADILNLLEQDPDPEIATEAMLQQFRHQPSVAAWQKLWGRVEQGQSNQEQSARIVQSLRWLGEPGFPFLLELTSIDNASLRLEAVRLFLMMGLDEAYPGTLKRFLEDPSKEVRRQAIHRLSLRGDLLENGDFMEKLALSRYGDVREGMVELAMPDEVARTVLGDLLLDADNRVRVTALKEYGRRELPDWDRYAAASLRDPDPSVQRVALGLVIQMEPEKRDQIIETFLRDYPDAPLARLIRAQINQTPEKP